jgi:hypothetical protein
MIAVFHAVQRLIDVFAGTEIALSELDFQTPA